MVIIYLITNTINGKIYVGQTTRSIEERWPEHVQDRKRSKQSIHRAIAKYGPESFTIKELDKVEDERGDWLESFYIGLLKSYDNTIGYNLTFGGLRTIKTPEARKKTSETMKGRIPWAWIKAAAEANRNREYTPNRLGAKHTEESRRKISLGVRGKKRSPEFVEKIRQISLKREEQKFLKTVAWG